MIPSSRMAFAALLLCAGQALAARPLLAELPARPPAIGPRAMLALALEACLCQAHDLDRTGVGIATEIAAIDRIAAEGVCLQNQTNVEHPMLGGYDEAGPRMDRHEQLTKKLQAGFPLYQQKQKAYDAASADFDRDCAQGFTASNLATVKTKLGIK
jgi:hypothetical protein